MSVMVNCGGRPGPVPAGQTPVEYTGGRHRAGSFPSSFPTTADEQQHHTALQAALPISVDIAALATIGLDAVASIESAANQAPIGGVARMRCWIAKRRRTRRQRTSSKS
jgi:hypothetical protein